MKILITGGSGLVGSRIIELLPEYSFEDISRKNGTDIVDAEQVKNRIAQSDAPVVLHFAAKTDVDGCEYDKPLGEDGEAWQINVKGTQNIVRACEETEKKLLSISTDMVFDGDKAQGELYTEEDMPNPKNWYAQTKFEGEKLIQQAQIPWVILRIAYPYRANFEKKEYVRTILSRLQQGTEVKVVTDHFFTPTFIDDIVQIIRYFIEQNKTGIYHVVGNESVNPSRAAHLIAQVFGLNPFLIHETTRAVFFHDRAFRPFNLSLKNDKIVKLGFTMRPFTEGLKEIKKQMQNT